jgi:hypothetical protein
LVIALVAAAIQSFSKIRRVLAMPCASRNRGYRPMETASHLPAMRRQAIATALTAEVERQAHAGASRIDFDALAEAVDVALEPEPPISEGKRPSELNATNDD